MVAVSVAWARVVPLPPDADAAFLRRLSEAERERAQRYRLPRDRTLFAVARALVRHMLTSEAGAREWRFVADARGKLAVDPPFGEPRLEFNVSHTDGAVACAVTRGIPVGIDVETVDRELAIDDVADSVFAPEERRAYAACANGARADYFFTLWTLKEAIAKACGLGLAMPFAEMCLGLEPHPHVVRDPANVADSWELAVHAPMPSHRLAVALQKPPGVRAAITIREIAIAELLAAE